MAPTFVSYAREDAVFVEGELAPALEQRGEDVWIDVEDIRGGAADWRASVWAGIEAAKAVVFVLSPASLASTVCAEELAHAEALNKRIVPALLESVDGAAMPAALERPNWVPAHDFDALGAALELDEAWLDAHARLIQRTVEWLRHDRDGSYLLRGSDLRTAERWLDEPPGNREPPTADQILYVTASGRAAARRLRSLLAGVVLALAVTAALAIVALVARAKAIDREQTARAQAWTAQATAAIVSGDIEASLRDGLRASAIRPDSRETVFTLRRALAATQWTALIRPSGAQVEDVEFSPDGRSVATASRDGTVAVWHGARRRLSLHAPGAINTVQFSPDGRELLTASGDGTARTWDRATGRPRLILRAGAPVNAATYGGDFIFTAGTGLATVWDARSGRVVERLGKKGQLFWGSARLSEDGGRVVTATGRLATLWGIDGRRLATLRMGDVIDYALFSADGRRLATSDLSGALAIWGGHRRLALIPPAHGRVADMDFSQDGRRLVAGFADGVVEVWDAASGARLTRFAGGTGLGTVQFDRRGEFVVPGDDDGVARVWRVGDGRALAVLSGHTAAIVRARFSPDGQRVVTGSSDGSARVWPARARTPSGRRWDGADAAQFAPDSRHVLLVRGAQRGVWDTATGGVVDLRGGIFASGDPATQTCGLPAGCTPFSPDSGSVAGVTRHSRAVVWDATTGAVEQTLARSALSALFSPDGRGVVVVGGNQPVVRIVDPESGRDVGAAKAAGREDVATAQYVLSRVITVDTHGRARLTDLATGASPKPIEDVLPRTIASARGWIAIGKGKGGLVLLDGKGSSRRVGHERLNSVALDRAGTTVAGGGQRGRTELWNTRTLSSVSLTTSGDQVTGIQFSPDGALVLVTSGSVARIWDRALRREVASLPATPGARARFSPDGKRIVLSGANRVQVLACAACGKSADLQRRAGALLAEDDPQARRVRQRHGA